MAKNVTSTALAAHLTCSRETIASYCADGTIERLPSGQYDQDQCRARLLQHLRNRAAGRAGHAGGDLAAERAKLARAQTQAAEFKNGIANGTYVKVAAVAAIVTADYAVIRERLLTIPGAISDALEGRSREEREEVLREEISRGAKRPVTPGKHRRAGRRRR